jgi:hypothetical protein
MTEQETIAIIEDVTWQDNGRHYGKVAEARSMAIKALEKQIELRENCEGSCSDCKYRGDGCANDLLIDIIEV